MSEEVLKAISGLLNEGTRFSTESVPVLEEEGYLQSFKGKPICEECGADISGSVDCPVDGMDLLVCKQGHEFTVPTGSGTRYKLLGDRILEDVCTSLGYKPVNVEKRYPQYVIAEIGADMRLGLVCEGRNIETILGDLFVDSIKQNRVNALLIPDSFDGLAYETASQYPLGALAPTFPLSMLTASRPVAEMIDSAQMSLERSKKTIQDSGWENNDLIRNLQQNPRLIEAELYYCRVFRESGYSGSLGDRFEDVCKAAFSMMDFTLDPEFGGTNDRFKNVTDIAFLIPPSSRLKEDAGRILGLVDTKSGSETHLRPENIAQKHANYLRQASHPCFEDVHISHVFVVFSMKGRESNEIAWYDAIEREYQGENDGTMVVLYADALAQMLAPHLSMVERNEINNSIGGGIMDAFRPFFNYRLFKRRLGSDIRKMTRVDDEISVGEDKDKMNYQQEYLSRERLLVVTKEMVEARYQEVVEDDEIADVLSNYPSDRW